MSTDSEPTHLAPEVGSWCVVHFQIQAGFVSSGRHSVWKDGLQRLGIERVMRRTTLWNISQASSSVG